MSHKDMHGATASKRGPPARTASDPPPPAALPRLDPGLAAPPAEGFAAGSVSASLFARFAEMLREEVAPLEARVQDLETLGAQHDIRLGRHDEELVALKEQIKKVHELAATQATRTADQERRLVEAQQHSAVVATDLREVRGELALAASSAPLPTAPAPGWDREIDPKILRLSSNCLLDLVAFEAAVDELLRDANVQRNQVRFELEGAVGSVSKRSLLLFEGEARTAARRASAVLGAMRTGSGWRRLTATAPGGAAAGAQVYLDRDQNLREIVHGRLSRRLRDAIRRCGHPSAYVQRSSGSIIVDYLHVAKVDLGGSEETAELRFQQAALDTLQLSKQAVEEAYASAGPVPLGPWV